METRHFSERFQERVGVLDIPSDLVMSLYDKSIEVTRNSRVESESVCIHIFNKDVVEHDSENELWVMIRNNVLVTVWRRNSENRDFTSCDGMRVDSVSYQLK